MSVVTIGQVRSETAADALAASRSHCEVETRKAARNFYYGLRLLSEPKRSSMYALYTYMRVIDDLVDDEVGRPAEHREADLERWKALTREALRTGAPPDAHPLWPAFIDMVARHAVPPTVFEDAIAGQAADLAGQPFQTFEALERYCYLVAGTVGVGSVYVFGFRGGDDTLALAVKRGIAFQLTNILRDLREDAGRGRIYLPQDELGAAGLRASDFQPGVNEGRVLAFLREQAARAERYYNESAELESRIDAEARPTLRAMTEIYHGLLVMIAADPARVLRERVSLSLVAKLRIGWRAARGK